MLRKYQKSDERKLFEFWNHEGVRAGYKALDEAEFSATFTSNKYFSEDLALILEEEDEICGFACGCVGDDIPHGKIAGYITCVVLDNCHETRENMMQMIKLLEDGFKTKGRSRSDYLFFNPMRLTWLIKGTDGHEHNNAPGVFKTSVLYSVMKELGYKEVTNECAMHMNLEGYEIPERIIMKEREAASLGYEVEFYEKLKVDCIDAMLEDFDNPLWSKEIAECAANGTPILFASKDGKAVGFAGPTVCEPSGRAYFSGIGVNKAHEGHGLGTILFYKLLYGFKLVGVKYVTLFTGKENKAKEIYMKAGFTVEEEFATFRKEI